MRLTYKILRSLLAIVLAIAVLLPATLFVALSFPSVQRDICEYAERELTTLLAMKVDIGDVAIAPFNRVTLHKVCIVDEKGDTAFSARRLGGGIQLFDLLLKRKLVFNYAEIVGLEANVSRDSIGAPLNIQPLIDALSPKDKSKPPTAYDFRINTVVIRKSNLNYDVKSEPEQEMRFDPNHVQISDLRADVQVLRISNDDYDVSLKRLAFSERSGFIVKRIGGDFRVTSTGTVVSGLTFELDNSLLAFGDLLVEYKSWADLKSNVASLPLRLSIMPESYILAEDLAPFVPALKGVDEKVGLKLDVSGSIDDVELEDLEVSALNGDVWLRMEGNIRNLSRGADAVNVDMHSFSVGGYGADVADILERLMPNVPENVKLISANLEHINVSGSVSGGVAEGDIELLAEMAPGSIEASGRYGRVRGGYRVQGEVETKDFDGATMFENMSGALGSIGEVSFKLAYDMEIGAGGPYGKAAASIARAEFKGHGYENLMATLELEGKKRHLEVDLDNEDAKIAMSVDAHIDDKSRKLQMALAAEDINLYELGLIGRYPGHRLSVHGDVDMSGSDVDDMEGEVNLYDVKFVDESGSGLNMNSVYVNVGMSADSVKTISLLSDVIDGRIEGNYSYAGLAPAMRDIMGDIFPSLIGAQKSSDDMSVRMAKNDFDYNFTIKDTSPLGNLVSLPFNVIYPVTVRGGMDYASRKFAMAVDAPYLQQKDKLIENTSLGVKVTADENYMKRADVNFTTTLPTKKGAMTLLANVFAADDRADADFSWKVARAREFKGDVRLSAGFGVDDGGGIRTRVNVNPSEMVFNDTVWTVNPATIDIAGNRVTVDGFRVGRQSQYIALNGQASSTDADSLMLVLKDVNLDYIFETLDIGNAMFGGIATGTFYASSLFSGEPKLYTPLLSVENMSYNHSLMGNAKIRSNWRAEDKAVVIDAVIDQPNGCNSKILGAIFPMADSLDFHFNADKIEIGFMKPFMEAFASEVSGFASGKARLWGTFKFIDMVGDIYAQNVKLKLDFTNTSYIATDSVHLTPGRIQLDNIELRDIYGHKGLLNGWITHTCFKQPHFNFSITDARDMLVYDVKESPEAIWYGTIYGNGSAGITGVPGQVDINVDMSTASRSTFTFVLSDAEQAYDYNFITFRDRDQARKDSLKADRSTPQIVRELKRKIAMSEDGGGSSVYNMNIAVDVTPSALVTLVMDPVGGDRIRAYGSGNLRMSYNSANEDLKMFGTYTLTRGNYNFTLQDIIIKDFTIRDGSSISFHGDPYAALLNIEAAYSVNANLSDLDESFLEDKELNRTNVPVRALLQVTGDMRQPDIGFDLEFPTLTQDTYRKVKSIVSTEDMMNRQIIYLLALNRFYTPDYMSTTKGNELVSVASSTISSQLSSILGQLSDNWSIAPNFRSDRGDFSDVEVDLALSSHLLNNRLLFNGNFGYRDKSLNNNSFIGDFDIEYLLNRSGSIRLKAYNRYNDQNYYVKNSLTTQGVGVVFKRDFDNILSFLNPFKSRISRWRHKNEEADTVSSPRIKMDGDTIAPKK